MKAFKVTENAIFYKVSAPSKVNRRLVDSVNWPDELRALCFEFKPFRLNAAKPLSFDLAPRYTANIVCYSPAGGPKGAAPVPVFGIETRVPASFAEKKRVAGMDEKIFLRLWGKKMSPEAKGAYSLMAPAMLRKMKALIALKKGKPVGFFGYMAHKGVSGKTFDSVTSWNLFPGLTSAERRSALYQAGLWLKKTSKRPNSVSLGVYEKDLQKFFAGAGFICQRVVIERMSGVKKRKG